MFNILIVNNYNIGIYIYENKTQSLLYTVINKTL